MLQEHLQQFQKELKEAKGSKKPLCVCVCVCRFVLCEPQRGRAKRATRADREQCHGPVNHGMVHSEGEAVHMCSSYLKCAKVNRSAALYEDRSYRSR